MATPRTAVRLVALAMTTAALTAGLPPAGVQANPSRATATAADELRRLNEQVDIAVEDFHDAEIALAKARRADAHARAALATEEARLRGLEAGLGEVVAAAYRSGGGSPLLALMTSRSTATFVNGASSLDHLARSKSEQLGELTAARRELKLRRKASERELASVRKVQAGLAAKRTEIEAAVTKQETIVARLTTADERRAAADRAAADLAARARADRSSRDTPAENQPTSAPRADRSRRETPENTGPVPSSGRGAAAVRFAYAQLGKPYVWAADGPDSYDCSGLTMKSWGAAGVSLSHSSRAQINEGRRVSKSQLAPGDLVFYGSPIHHVGIYIGGGRKIAAPQTGDVVKIGTASRPDFVGAVRPG